jgi:hypothetical protein
MTSKERKYLEGEMGKTLKATLEETKKSGFSGRPWGVGKSLFLGSHVILGIGDEIVSTFVKDNQIHILEYKKTTRTVLGKKVHAILEAKHLQLAK